MKQLSFTFILILAFCVFSFAQSEKSTCPTINVVRPSSITYIGEPAFFSVELSDEAKNLKVEYEWKVEGGEIAGGQGTTQITMLPKMEGANLKATVKVKGLPENCSHTAWEIAGIAAKIACGLPFDNYARISLDDEYARLDSFIISLSQERTLKGFIVISTDKNESVEAIKKHIRLMLKHFKFREFSKERIIFAIEKSDYHSTKLIIVPEGADFPECENCEILKGKNL